MNHHKRMQTDHKVMQNWQKGKLNNYKGNATAKRCPHRVTLDDYQEMQTTEIKYKMTTQSTSDLVYFIFLSFATWMNGPFRYLDLISPIS